MNLRRLLSDKRCKAVHVAFGRCSEAAALKAGNLLLVGVCISGVDLRDEKDTLRLFRKHGCVLMERSPKLVVEGKQRRALLLCFAKKSQCLGAAQALKASGRERSRFRVAPARPTMVWTAYKLGLGR